MKTNFWSFPLVVHANKKVLLSCLQKAHPVITNDSFDTVMDRYRPGGHEAQEPR